ncbi:MAG: hypothetical protein RLZZ519_2507 [Bacteroidota bacterium]|jgi:hypothetical protein
MVSVSLNSNTCPMKKSIFTILIATLTVSLLAQAPRFEFRHLIKIGNATTWGPRPIRVKDAQGIEVGIHNALKVDLLQFTPTFGWQTKRGDLCEVAITNWAFRYQETSEVASQGLVSGSVRTTDLGAKFSYFTRFLKKKDHLVSILLGLEVMPLFDRYHSRPALSTMFPELKQNVSVAANIAPRIAFYPNSRFFADVTGSITLAEYHLASLIYSGNGPFPSSGTHNDWLGILEGNFGLTVSAGIKF